MGPPSSSAVGTDSTHEMALCRNTVFFPNTVLTPHLHIPRTSGIQLRQLCLWCSKACGRRGRERSDGASGHWARSGNERRPQVCRR